MGKDAGVHMFRGEVLLHYYLTGETDYSNLSTDERCRFQEIDPDYDFLLPSFFFSKNTKKTAIGMTKYPAGISMGGLVSAITCRIFHKYLDWLDPVDAHNLGSLLFGALTVLVVYLFALEAFGLKTAFFSSIFLALYPPFIGYSHISIKDMPALFFISATIWTFWKGFTHKNYRWMWLSVILFGMGLVSKLNTLYALIIIGVWLILSFKRQKLEIFSQLSAKFWSFLLLSPVVVILVYLFFAPRIWHENPYNLLENMKTTVYDITGIRNYAITKKTTFTKGQGEKPWRIYHAPMHALLTIPLPILFFAVFGAWFALQKRRENPEGGAWLAFIWTIAPVLFCMLPYLNIYDSIRHFLAYIPGVCLLAGLGVNTFYSSFKKIATKYLSPDKIPGVYTGFVVLMIAFEAVSVVQYHPYEITFFNNLVGGLKGAQNLKIPFSSRVGIPDAEDFRGTSIRNAMKWLDKHGKTGNILVLFNPKSNKFIRLKKGIKILPYNWDNDEKQRKILTKITFDTAYIVFNNTYYNRIHPLYGYCYNKLTPLYTSNITGVPVSWVYQMPREQFLHLVFPEQQINTSGE